MTPLHFEQWPAMAGKTGEQRVPHQHLIGLQRLPIENPFHYRSVAVGGFLEDGTSLWASTIVVGESMSQELVAR